MIICINDICVENVDTEYPSHEIVTPSIGRYGIVINNRTPVTTRQLILCSDQIKRKTTVNVFMNFTRLHLLNYGMLILVLFPLEVLRVFVYASQLIEMLIETMLGKLLLF